MMFLKNLRVKDLPFVAGQDLMKGAENLAPDDSIEPILKTRYMGNRIYRTCRNFSCFNRKTSWRR